MDAIVQQYASPQERLFQVIDEFVKQLDPQPTWRVIVQALRNPLIREYRLAQKIAKKYCPQLAEPGTGMTIGCIF